MRTYADDRVRELLHVIQQDLLRDAAARLESATQAWPSPADVDGPGLFRMPYDAVGDGDEQAPAERGYTMRCPATADGALPESRETPISSPTSAEPTEQSIRQPPPAAVRAVPRARARPARRRRVAGAPARGGD